MPCMSPSCPLVWWLWSQGAAGVEGNVSIWDGHNEHLTDEVELLPGGVDPRDIDPDVVALTVELGRHSPYIHQPGAPMNRIGRAVIGSKWLADHDRKVAAAAWERGFNEGHYTPGEKLDCDCKVNPFEIEEN